VRRAYFNEQGKCLAVSDSSLERKDAVFVFEVGDDIHPWNVKYNLAKRKMEQMAEESPVWPEAKPSKLPDAETQLRMLYELGFDGWRAEIKARLDG
jgi:hypothetical protein